MSAMSGLYGKVGGQSTIRNWSLNKLGNPKLFVASNTRTGTGTRKGALDWNGSFQAYGASPLILPGQKFTFEGFTGDASTPGRKYSGPAIVDQLALTINYGAQDIVSYSINFSADGALAETPTVGGVDSTYPDAPPACEAVVSLIDPDGTANPYGYSNEIPDMTNLVVTLTSANKAYVNSSTKVGTKVWTRRKEGPKNWTAAITRHDEGGIEALDVHDYMTLLIDVDTASWIFKWGTVGDNSNLQVNIETGDIIGITHNLTMNVAPHSETTIGQVTTPAGLWLPTS